MLIVLKKLSSNPMSQRFAPIFFIVLSLTLNSLIHLDLPFLNVVRLRSNVFLLHGDIQMPQCLLLKRSFLPWFVVLTSC